MFHAAGFFFGDLPVNSCIDKHIPMDKEILHKFLKCGYIDTGKLFPTQAGTPQGGSISPTIANMVLDGLEFMLNKRFRKHYENGVYVNPKVNLVRYADDFIITGESRELLESQVKPLVEAFMDRTRPDTFSGKDGYNQHLRWLRFPWIQYSKIFQWEIPYQALSKECKDVLG